MTELEVLAAGELPEALVAHREAWPKSRLALTELVSSVVAEVLSGATWTTVIISDDCCQLTIPGFTQSDEAVITNLVPPSLGSTTVARWAPNAGRLVNTDVTAIGVDIFGMHWLEPGPATTLARNFVSPVFQKLMACWRLRTEPGPKTLKARLRLVDDAIDAHRVLGLDPEPSVRLLEPNTNADELQIIRRQIKESWQARPDDFAHRVTYLLARDIARQAAKKIRKDGTVAEADVLTARLSERAIGLFGGWEAIVEYLQLGETRGRSFVPPATLPANIPSPVAERANILVSWWRYADGLLAAQSYLDPPLKHLNVRRSHPLERFSQLDIDELELPPPFASARELDRLWGFRSDKRDPIVLVPDREPTAAMMEALGSAYWFWADVSESVYYLTHRDAVRSQLEELASYYQRRTDALRDAGTPINHGLWADLRAAAGDAIDDIGTTSFRIILDYRGIAEHLKADDANQELVKALEETADYEDHVEVEQLFRLRDAFHAMRDVVTEHRRNWLSEHRDSWLEHQWTSAATLAATAYAEAVEDRDGRPPTAKGAWPLLGQLANTWFGGDCSQLANSLGLEGPITIPPEVSPRELPDDLDGLMREVLRQLDGDVESRDWHTRRRGELAGRTPEALEHWAITGNPPQASALRIPHILNQFGNNSGDQFERFLHAIGGELQKLNHPAADAFSAAS